MLGLIRRVVIAAVALPCLAYAQAARPASAAHAASAASAAMERAQRLAESPMRAILEAAKVRRRGEPDASAGASDLGVARRASPMRVAAEPSRSAAAAPVPTTPVVVIGTLPAQLPPVAEAQRVDAIAASRGPRLAMPSIMPELPSIDAPVAPAAAASAAPLAPPRLLHMVAPEVSARLLDQLSRPEVTLEFTIRPDGSVTDVVVLPPAPRQLQSILAEALEKWRFEPVAAPRSHRIQLVFNPAR